MHIKSTLITVKLKLDPPLRHMLLELPLHKKPYNQVSFGVEARAQRLNQAFQ